MIRILRFAARTGYEEYLVSMGIRVWCFGWFLRVVMQVIFFASIGRLLGSEDQVQYLLVGNAVMLAGVGALLSVAGTTWERRAGTLPLLIASPTSPVLVFSGRSLAMAADGVVIATGALIVVGPIFGLAVPWPRMPLVVLLLILVALSTYALGTFLGGLVLRAMSMRNLVGNIAQTTMMAICGVNVPVSYYSQPVQWLAEVLPMTHGLQAIRDLLAGETAATILPNIGFEMLVGVGWLTLSLLTFNRLAEQGRRDGSIEFAA